MKLNKGDKVTYIGHKPYKLANEQEVFNNGDKLIINSNVNVQDNFFVIEKEVVKETNKNEELKESKNIKKKNQSKKGE